MFEIVETTMGLGRTSVLATAESIDAAEAVIRERFPVVYFYEVDGEDGADALVAFNKAAAPLTIAVNRK